MSASVSFDPMRACEDCGATGAFVFEVGAWCVDCYAGRGSCCAEREIAEPPSCSAGSCSAAGSMPTKPDASPTHAPFSPHALPRESELRHGRPVLSGRARRR